MANAKFLEFVHHNLVTENEADLTSSIAADVLAIPTSQPFVSKTTGDNAEALTLANGEPGQLLLIYLAVDGGGDGTLTPATATGWSTILFADAGDAAFLLFVNDTMGWVILSTYGLTAQPTVAA